MAAAVAVTAADEDTGEKDAMTMVEITGGADDGGRPCRRQRIPDTIAAKTI